MRKVYDLANIKYESVEFLKNLASQCDDQKSNKHGIYPLQKRGSDNSIKNNEIFIHKRCLTQADDSTFKNKHFSNRNDNSYEEVIIFLKLKLF